MPRLEFLALRKPESDDGIRTTFQHHNHNHSPRIATSRRFQTETTPSQPVLYENHELWTLELPKPTSQSAASSRSIELMCFAHRPQAPLKISGWVPEEDRRTTSDVGSSCGPSVDPSHRNLHKSPLQLVCHIAYPIVLICVVPLTQAASHS